LAARRFLLLPEDPVGEPGERPRIRRYQLASIGRRSASDGAELALARLTGELGQLFHDGG
jgi:hypothetical protein